MLLIISAVHYNKLFVNVFMNILIDLDLPEMKKYEYCVKIVIICYYIHDSPSDYDEGGNSNYDQYIKKNGCVNPLMLFS